MLASAESDSAQANSARSRTLRMLTLRGVSAKNKFLSKTILACLTGAQMASIHEIQKRQKSRDTAPLIWRQPGQIKTNF